MRRTPEAALDACLPKLRALIGDYKISGDIKIRPIDLYESDNVVQPGVVLGGDLNVNDGLAFVEASSR